MVKESQISNSDYSRLIKSYAINTLGFDDCGFTDPFPGREFEAYKALVQEKELNDLAYLNTHFPLKQNPALLLNDVKSAVVLIKNYKNTPCQELTGNYKLSRFAVGMDYHFVIKKRLSQLEAFIIDTIPGSSCYSGVDSRPISERSLALKSGVGILGKNNMVIHPIWGSYFFISVVLSTYPFGESLKNTMPLEQSRVSSFETYKSNGSGTIFCKSSDPAVPAVPAERAATSSNAATVATTKKSSIDCLNCNKCVNACPVGAISTDGTLDPFKCISYRTIEQKTPLTQAELNSFEGWVFGCDRCQEVCPYNKPDIPLTDWPEFLPESGVGFSFITDVISGNKDLKIPKHSPLYRSKKQIKNLSSLTNF
ncbi:epoxyqueuosine reductase [Thermoproteota archaeon]